MRLHYDRGSIAYKVIYDTINKKMQCDGCRCNRIKWNELEQNGWHRMERVAGNGYAGIGWDGLEWVTWKQMK